MKRYLPFVVIAAVMIVALCALFFLVRSSRQSTNTRDIASSDPPGAQPQHVRGNADAKVTLEEFGDFQCPTCGLYYSELKKIEDEYGQRLRVIFREYPLYPNHKYGVLAAQAAEAAGMQDRFWEMHDKLYENQNAWSDAKDALPIFVDYANQIGLDPDRFKRDLSGDAVGSRITLDGIRAHSLGVVGTPTIFINRKEVKGDSMSPDGIREMIKTELSGAGGP